MYTRGDRRDDRRDSRLVYTLQATGRRDYRSDSRGDDRPVYTAYNCYESLGVDELLWFCCDWLVFSKQVCNPLQSVTSCAQRHKSSNDCW